MRIELLHVPDCPNIAQARARLREALDAVGVHASISEVEVATAAAAEATGMQGSPTILVDGADPFATSSPAHPSLACRLFQTPYGLAGVPTVSQLVEVLAR